MTRIGFNPIPKNNIRDELFRCILICNDAVIINGKLNCNSQDEKVLLELLETKYECRMLSRTTDKVEIEMGDEVETY